MLFMFTGCEKVMNDKIPPTLVLKGNNPLMMFRGCPYPEPGYDVKDDKTPVDLIEVNTITDHINTDSTGVYLVNYTATDTDGNVASATRKLIIEELTLDYYIGTLTAHDTLKPLNQPVPSYQVTCDVFNTEFSWIRIYNFNNFGEDFNVIIIPDSLGNIGLSYSLSDTLITGTGNNYCDKRGFRLEYQVETPDDGVSIHHVTYKF
jgi:hypothetical protein